MRESFLDEQLFLVSSIPWFVDLINYLVSGEMPSNWSKQDRVTFLTKVKQFYWDDPYLFKHCADQVIRRCVPEYEFQSILSFCHSQACGGHFGVNKTTTKVLQCGFYWPNLFKDDLTYCSNCAKCQQLVRISKENMMPLNPIHVIEVFDIWGIDFMGPFINSFDLLYILLVVDYVSKWVEGIPCRTNDTKVVLPFLKEFFFSIRNS